MKDTRRTAAARSAHILMWPAGLIVLAAAAAGCATRPADPRVHVIAFGDSTTKGPTGHDYSEMLADKLALPRDAVANEGSGGETSSRGAKRLRDLLIDRTYPNAHTVLVWLGGDDVIDFVQQRDPHAEHSPTSEAYAWLEELSELLWQVQWNIQTASRSATLLDMVVLVVTYPAVPYGLDDCPPLPGDRISPEQVAVANEYVMLLNDAIATAADNTGALLVHVEDLNWLLLAEPDRYFHDCVHLSADGNDVVAQAIAQAMIDAGYGGE